MSSLEQGQSRLPQARSMRATCIDQLRDLRMPGLGEGKCRRRVELNDQLARLRADEVILLYRTEGTGTRRVASRRNRNRRAVECFRIVFDHFCFASPTNLCRYLILGGIRTGAGFGGNGILSTGSTAKCGL